KPIHGFTLEPTTVGEHLRNWRLRAGLTQKDVAARLGADPLSVVNWERGRTDIHMRFYSPIIALLGFNPLPDVQTLGERIRRARLTRGLFKKRVAALGGIDEATLAKLEADVATPYSGPKSSVLQELELAE
ncbi:MAG: helix-turn-helix transcriptional regulator, partial [Gemmatimonadaceae bacterium]|nr:helix-turn-helix transcriptional regulator [Gemmatimonadaceae bacterium]